MTTTSKLAKANQAFRDEKYKDALLLYREHLASLRENVNAPKSFAVSSERFIFECKKKLNLDLSVQTTHEQDENQKSKLNALERIESITQFQKTPASARLPLVSIILPSYNSGKLLYEALDSIKDQSFREIETIIIDDKSTDGSLQENRLSAYPRWMRLILVRLKINSGPSACRNIGFSVSQGRGICLLDSDDYLDKKTLAERWRLLDSDPNIAATFSTMTYVDINRKELGTVILKDAKSFAYGDFVSNKFPCSALLIRRRALALDPFDNSFVYGEDYECFSRIAQRGGIYRIASGTVYYRQHGNSLTHKDAYNDLQQRVGITNYVHSREVDWSYFNSNYTLAKILAADAISMRAFPVACVYALRSQLDKAEMLGTLIDADLVASKPPLSVSGSIRFFITREEFQPGDKLQEILAKSDTEALRKFLASFFSIRHQKFLSELLDNLLPAKSKAKTAAIPLITSACVCCSWREFMNGPNSDNGWRGYVAIHRDSEHFPEEAQKSCIAHLTTKPYLEGLYAFRLLRTSSEILVDVDTIGPADPDSPEINRLGKDLWPALFLHELAARALWGWLMHPPTGSGLQSPPSGEVSLIEQRVLEGVRALRLRIVGGVAACHVLCNHVHEEVQ